MADRRIDNAVARGLHTQTLGERLAGPVGDGRVFVQGRLACPVDNTEIVKRSEEIGQQLGMVGDVSNRPIASSSTPT